VAEEYPLAAGAFARILREQREMQLKGGIYHLTQIAMAYNSNRIEGSALSVEQTWYLYERRTVLGEAPLNDVVETSNHFRAFDVMLDRVGEPNTAESIKEYHRILKSGTQDAEKDWFAVGDWKKLVNEVGGIATTPPSEVQQEINSLVTGTPAEMTFGDVCDFHVRFEQIHPFQDGNGQVGRLILFEQCLWPTGTCRLWC
jgi:Fic family protein